MSCYKLTIAANKSPLPLAITPSVLLLPVLYFSPSPRATPLVRVSLGGLPLVSRCPFLRLLRSVVLFNLFLMLILFQLSSLPPFRLQRKPLPRKKNFPSSLYSVCKIYVLPWLILLLESERKRTLDERSNARY